MDGSAALDVAPALEPIQAFLADRRVAGWIVSMEERVTDVLNRRVSLRVCVDPANDEWQIVDVDEVLIVAPPTQAVNPARRLHRRRQRMMAPVGPYVVSGVVSLPPGQEPVPFLRRTKQAFLPMTDVRITHRTDPAIDERLPVAIVSVAHLGELQPQVAAV